MPSNPVPSNPGLLGTEKGIEKNGEPLQILVGSLLVYSEILHKKLVCRES